MLVACQFIFLYLYCSLCERFRMLFEFSKSFTITDKNDIVQFQNVIRKPLVAIKFYKTLVLTNVTSQTGKTVSVGDNVLIANEEEDFPYIATVEAFYVDISDDNCTDEKYAIVKWFYRPQEIPTWKLPDECLENEIFLCTSKADQIIDAETIVDTCAIHNGNTVASSNLAKNSFYCRKSFDGRRFKNLPTTRASHLSESKATPASPKVTVAKRSIQSTLSATKSLKVKPYLANKVLNSPVTASSVGRLDAGQAINDILGFENDLSGDDTKDDVNNVSTPHKRKSIHVKHIAEVGKVITPTKTLSQKNLNSEISLTPTERKLKNLSVSVRRLSPDLEKENSRPPALSSRKQKKKADTTIPVTPIQKLNLDASSSSDESNSKHIGSTSCRDSPSKKPKLSLRRSTRKSAKQKVSVRKKLELDGTKSDLDDSDMDQDYELNKEDLDSSGSDLDFMPSMKSAPRTLETKSPRRSLFVETPKSSRKSLKIKKVATPKTKTPKKPRAYIPETKTPVKLAASDFDRARERLHVSAVPDSLPCREDEFQAIYSFVEGKIKSGTGGCMYISGVPGTGKTATVMEVLSSLRETVADGSLQDFNFVDINGMRLTEPHQAYVSILKQLKDMKATADHAAELLTNHFNMRGRKATLMVVDELDLLCTKKQDVLYHLFDWPTHRHARLIVIAIANTMDLPERVMMNKVSSRLGLTRLSFLPYNFKQLQEIVTSRLRGLPVFEADALQLVARKIAAVSGDARRCLDVCRRTMEIAEKNRITTKGRVQAAKIAEVHEALQEMFATPVVMLMRNCSIHEQLFLQSVVAEFRRAGLEEATLGQIIQHHSTLAHIEGLPPSNHSSLLKVCNQLVASRLILLEMGGQDIYSRVRLNVSVDDVLFALNYE